MFSAPDDDDDFSVSSGGSSKLASLFNADGGGGGGVHDDNRSFTYNAPKQPKKPKPASSGSQPATGSAQPQMSILHAVAVHVFKYDGTKHVSEGKMGLAIVGNHESLVYKLLLYKGQKQHVAFATVTAAFVFVIQANNYANFYDDAHQNWSINFDTARAVMDFAKQVCLAKASTAKVAQMKSTISQDLAPGDGDALEAGDLVEIKYTGWYFANNSFGDVFDSNVAAKKALRFRIGKGKLVKGLEDGVAGMKKNGKRLVVVPPCCGYADVEKAEASLKVSTLIYEVEVLKCKFGKDSASTHSSTPDHAELELERKDSLSRSHSSSVSDDSTVRARCASLSEQLTQSPNKKKATIISRIVKMGQPMLPLQGAVVAQPSSESETEEELATSQVVNEPVSISGEATTKPIPKPRPQQAMSNIQQMTSAFETQPGTLAQAMNVLPSTQVLPHTLPLATNPPFALLPQSSFAQAVQSPIYVGGGDGHLQLLLTENRTQNTELRMHMAKLAEKLDTILAKVDSRTVESATAAFPNMESRVLSHNVQRVCRENESLQTEVKDKGAKIEAQNEKICELLQKNQKYIEQSTSLLEQRNSSMQTSADQLQSKLRSLEDENRKLQRDLEDVRDQLRDARTQSQEAEEKVGRVSEEKQNIAKDQEKMRETVERYESQKNVCEKEIQELRSQLAAIDNVNKTSAEKTAEDARRHEDELTDLRNQLQRAKTQSSPSAATSSPDLVNEVKKIMNAVYKHLQSEFAVDEQYAGAYVNKQLKDKIIDITLHLTRKYSQRGADDTADGPETVATTVDDASNADGEEMSGNGESVPRVAEEHVESVPRAAEEPALSTSKEERSIVVSKSPDNANKAELPGDHVSDTSEDYEVLLLFILLWKPQPPPPPSFIEEAEDDDDDDDWLK